MEWTWKPARRLRRAGKRSQAGGEGLIWKPIRVGRVTQLTPTVRQEKTVGEVVGQLHRERSYKCAFCKGEGEKRIGTKCPVCKGKGDVSILQPPVVRCAFCKGRGEDKPRSNVTCLACKGKGIVPVVEPIEVCAHCRGLGYEPGNSTLPCGRCRGKGVVTVKERVDGKKEEVKRYFRRPSGSEREAARVVYQLGEAGYVDIGARIGVSSTYAEYVCKSAVKRGYLEKVSRGIYVLTPECEKVMAEDEEKEVAKVTPEQIAMLRTIQEQGGECTAQEIRAKAGLAIDRVRKICSVLGEKDFIDVLRSGKYVLAERGEKVLGRQQKEQKSGFREIAKGFM